MSEELSQEQDLENKVEDCSDSSVVTKYRMAADIVNYSLQKVIEKILPDSKVVELCDFGDKLILDGCSKVFKQVKVPKGISFPTCISINNICGHFSPLKDDTTTLHSGDLVKIDMGCHIDGYIAVVAHSIIVPDTTNESKTAPSITGPLANIMKAAYYSMEICERKLQEGNKNHDITKLWAKIAETFHCSIIPQVFSHELKRNSLDNSKDQKIIISKLDPDQKVEQNEFALNEAYSIDIVFSTGEGKPRELGDRCTIYKRVPDYTYHLNLQAARKVFSKVLSDYPVFPFTVRHFDDPRTRFGLSECVKHSLLQSYPVLHEKAGDFVCQFKCTFLLLPNNTLRITGIPIDLSLYESEYSITDPELLEILSRDSKKSIKKKKKSKKKELKQESKEKEQTVETEKK